MNLALTPAQDCLARHRVRVFGDGRRTLVFGPGFGCQQMVWEPVAMELARDHRVVLFDFHLDHALTDNPQAPPYDSLWAHGTDVVEMLSALDLHDAIFVGHSVAGMIGLAGGSAVMYQAMTSLGFAAESGFTGFPKLGAAPRGASVLVLGAGIAGMVLTTECIVADLPEKKEAAPAGGGMGATHGEPDTYPRLASDLGFIHPDDTLKVAEAILTTQRDFGNRESRKHARLKYTIDRMGVDALAAARSGRRRRRPLRSACCAVVWRARGCRL